MPRIRRVRVEEHPIGQFLSEKFCVSFRVGTPDHVPPVHYSIAFKTYVDRDDRIVYLGNSRRRALDPWELLHEACHINCHPPWEEMAWADEFVVMWGLEHAVMEDMVHRGLLSPGEFLQYMIKHFWKYTTEEGVAIGKYRSAIVERCLQKSMAICKEVGLLTKAGAPTYKKARWSPHLERKWKTFQAFRGISKLPSKHANSRTRLSEVITEDLARKIAKRRGLNLDLLKKDGKFLLGQLCEIPADVGYVTLSSDKDGFNLYGSAIDRDFVKALQ